MPNDDDDDDDDGGDGGGGGDDDDDDDDDNDYKDHCGYILIKRHVDNKLIRLVGANCPVDDECQYGNGGCEQVCIDTYVSYFCHCRSGYKLKYTSYQNFSCPCKYRLRVELKNLFRRLE